MSEITEAPFERQLLGEVEAIHFLVSFSSYFFPELSQSSDFSFPHSIHLDKCALSSGV